MVKIIFLCLNFINIISIKITVHYKKKILIKMELSKLHITGILDKTTPMIVLNEIIHSYNLNIFPDKNSISVINNYKTEFIDLGNINNMGKLSEFINPYCIWTYDSLMESYRTITSFLNNTLDFTNIEGGIPDDENPKKIPPSILYGICRRNGILTNYDTSLENLVDSVNLLNKNDVNIQDIIINKVKKSNKIHLLSILNLGIFNDTIQTPSVPLLTEVVNYENLRKNYKNFNSEKYLRHNIIPKNNNEAISLAAINFGYDISESKIPVQEYYSMKMDHYNYKPLDSNLKAKLKYDPNYTNLKMTFNPLFCEKYYSENDLITITNNEGYDIDEENLYETLQVVYVSPNFYFGNRPEIINEYTCIFLDPLSDIDPLELICHGIIDGSMIGYTFNELYLTFKSYQNYINPVNKELFSYYSIRKLKRMCLIMRNENKNITKKRRELYNLILDLEIKNDKSRAKFKLLRSIYKKYPLFINNFIIELFNLSMFMRGWNGLDIYPISKISSYNQLEVDLNITQQLYKLENLCRNFDVIKLNEHISINVDSLKHDNENISNENISNENISNENISNENISNENISNENISNEHIINENISNEHMINENENNNEDMNNEDENNEDENNEDENNEDENNEDMNNENENNKDINNEDMNNEDMNNEDMNNEDMNNEDMNNEDMSNEDMSNEDSIKLNGTLGSWLLRLPLVNFDNDFNICYDSDEGLNIQDRLNIIKKGNDYKSYQSCIRVSSNILAFTSYYLMKCVNMEPLFDHTLLKKIQ
jgi:hypothetical protein